MIEFIKLLPEKGGNKKARQGTELGDGHWGYRIVDTGRIRPQLSDLNVTRVDEIEPALTAWRTDDRIDRHSDDYRSEDQ